MNKKRITVGTRRVIIDIQYGSKWQEEAGNQRLDIVLMAYKQFTESLHKKNVVQIDILDAKQSNE